METLEDRRLLAVTPLSPLEAAALRDTSAAIGGFAARLDGFDEFNQRLPLLESTIGDFVNIDAAFGESFVDPIQGYLSPATANPTIEGFKGAIDLAILNAPHISGTVNVSDPAIQATELSFTIDVTYNRSVEVSYDLAEEISRDENLQDLITIEGDLSARLNFTLDFKITIGIDRTKASASAGAFVSFDNTAGQNQVTAEIVVGAQSPINASVGFLGVTLGAPTQASLSLGVKFDTIETTTQRDRVTLEQLSAPNLNTLALVAPAAANEFHLHLPISADLAGLELVSSSLKIDRANLFGTPTPIVVDTADLSEFRAVSADGLFGALQQIQNTFGGINTFDTEIPFTGGQMLSDVLNIGDAFGEQIIGASAAEGPENELIAAFKSAQQFADKVAQRLTYVPKTATAPAEILFDVSFDHLFNVATFPIDFGAGIGELNIQADSTLKVDAALAAALEIGIKLEQPGAGFDPDSDSIFGLENDTKLSELLGGKGVTTKTGNDLRITLRDGTTHELDLSSVTTIGDLITALTSGPLAGKLEVEFDVQQNLVTGGTYNQGLILLDKSESVAGGQLKFEMVGGSLAAPTLGLFGTGQSGIKLGADGRPNEDTFGLRTGPLHGESLANKVFVRAKTGVPMFSATASLSSDINGKGQLGFVEITIADGEALGALKAEFTPSYSTTAETDGRIDTAQIVKLASAAKLRLQAPKVVKFGEAYMGELLIEISKADGNTSDITLGFDIPETSSSDDLGALVLGLNAQLVVLGATNADANLVRVVSSGGKLNFFLTDGVGRFVTVKAKTGATQAITDANKAAAAKLGIKEDLTAFVATPKISGSAHFELPFDVDLNLGAFTLPALSRTLSFDVPDLTVSDFSLPENFNLDDLGLGGTGDYLKKLKSLNRDTIIQTLKDTLDLLKQSVAESPLFNQQLPMLNINIREVLDFTDTFAEIIANMNGTTASGLGQLDEVFEDIFGVAESNGGGAAYPDFAVSILPLLNKGLVFDGVKLDSIGEFPAAGKEFLGTTHLNLIAYLGALQADNDAFGLSLDESAGDIALRIDLPFDIGTEFGVEGQVDPLGFQVPISVDMADLGVSGLSSFVDARGDALVSAYALGQVKLSVGIELPETGAPRPFLFDGVTNGTSLGVLVRAAASPFAFDVSMGPIGAMLTDGNFAFGGTVTADPQNNQYANFNVGIKDDNSDGRHYFDEIVTTVQSGLDLDDFEFSGDLNASLTAQLGFSGLPIGPYAFAATVSDADLTDFTIDNFSVTIDGRSPADAIGDLKSALAEDFNILALVGGWDGAFDLMIDAMEGEVFGVELPFVGDKLKDQANFLRDIKNSVSANFSDNAANEASGTFTNIFDDVRQDLLDAVGPNGINLLKDLTGDNQVTIEDIVIKQLNPGVSFQILLGNDLGQLDLPIDFDLGIPGFSLDIDANVTGTLGFELGLSFGVDLDHGFYIDTSGSFMEVFVDVGVPGLSASGELGFLRIDADEILSPAVAFIGDGETDHSQFTISSKALGSSANFDVRIVTKTAADNTDFIFNSARRELTLKVGNNTTAQDVVSLISNHPTLSGVFSAALVQGSNGTGVVASGQRAVGVSNSFAGRFSVDILDPNQDDGKLTFGEILTVDSYKDVLLINATASAALDLHLLASFGGSNSFPSIQTDLTIDWEYELGGSVQLPTVQFKDISLDLGQFFSGFAETVLDEVDGIIDPVRPIINFLTEPVPVVSQLAGGSITMLDLLQLQGGSVAKAAAFIKSVADFDRILQSIPDLGEGKLLNIGGATFNPETGEFTADGSISAVKDALRGLAPEKDGFKPDDFLQSAADLENADDNKIKLGFPILDPSNIMGLLSGKVIDLFTLELPTLELDASIKKFFPLPVFPIVGVELAGAVSARVDFAFGFDTFGIQQFQQTGDFEDVFNGFFVFDHETADGGGADINEVELKAQITAAAALNAGFFRAAVGGGLFANIDFNLHDNDDDGKVRLVELLDNTLLGVKDGLGPIHIFDVGGKLDAGLFAEVTIGLGPFSYTKEFDLARVTVFEFEVPRPAGEGIPLAEMNGSTLVLNIGSRAPLRDPAGVLNFFGQNIGEDQAEDYRIFAGAEPGKVIVQSFGRTQIYTDVQKIVGDAGIGDDKITVSSDITIPVEISGGPGNDTIIGGSGNDILSGGDGNDDIRGGLGNDILNGDAGRDTLTGDAGNDTIAGGSENDSIFAGDGNDYVDSGTGNDTINAGSGNDIIYAGAGFDTVFGEGGDDAIYGGADGDLIEGGDGGDEIYGDEGDDRIFGNNGNDIIRGGIGNDVIRGGTGNDTIYGDEGDDQLFGENSRDIMYGGAGNDLLEGGLGADDLYGGLGNDKLYFNASDTSQVDEASHLLVGGGGDDLIYGTIAPNGTTTASSFDNTIFGDGVNDENGAVDNTLDGNDTIYGGKSGGKDGVYGKNTIYGGGGNDVITSYAGDDFIDAGSGNDKVYAGAGKDFVIGGFGDDELFGEAGEDVLWGGFATLTDLAKFDLSLAANFELPPRFQDAEAKFPTGFVPPRVTPKFAAGLSLAGVEGDGRDTLDGGDDSDLLFGGADSDVIRGGGGSDYIDAGAGNDINVDGGDGDDVIRGGGNNDVLHGGTGIDHILGDGGDDQLFGDAGIGANQLGQRLFGGDGSDTLNAYAPDATSAQYTLVGDQMFGDADGDTLNGNLRMEIMVGGAGDDLLRGDYLSGPNYATNTFADTTGGGDRMFGDGGEDKLFGGGGDDEMWGGPDTDYLDGQKGDDTQYGGGGNDLFVVSAMNPLQIGSDTMDGHFGNFPGDELDPKTKDDNATDVLIINGSLNNDVISLSQTIPSSGQPQLRIDYKSGTSANRPVFVTTLDASGNLLVEQFQIAGLAGNDILGFAGVHPSLLPLQAGSQVFDVTQIAARGDWTSTLEGNSGNDTIVGSKGRDRASGGPGSDTIYGLAGDDRLLGDNGDGFTTDTDQLFAGQGNDDLTGGQGTNFLYAWSFDPYQGGEFGVFTAADGSLVNNAAGGTFKQENTGLNRMLGNEGTDNLYGGTILDFMYGRGGTNTLYRSNGTKFESMGGAIPGDEWKEYAKETGQVWYVGGTNANDEIGVNFVTEPGLLSDHHLITRLTDNNGQVTFDAQVRLDFAATDADGNAIWTPNDLLADYAALRELTGNESLTDLQKLDVKRLETNLVNKLLPPEGDFQAIIIDALAGNDTIIVGPTVQKSVWIDAGDGDDQVTIRGGRAILADKAEIGKANGLIGRNDTAPLAYPLHVPAGGVQFDGLTIDHAGDVDWFKFTLPVLTGRLQVKTGSPIDDLNVQVFAADGVTELSSATGLQLATLNLATSGLVAGTEYLLKIQTNKTPTIYGVEFDFGAVGPIPVIDLGTRSDAVRRDIILGGRGDDILMGGPGEDWILGDEGNDVISGGLDRGAGDLLLGGAGDDTFQIIPDQLPLLGNQPNTVFDPASKTYLPTMNDEIDGGSGTDRMLYAGGNLDRRGFEVPDFAALRYNTGFHRYEFTSLIWDIGQQKFLHDYVDTNGNGQQDASEPDLATYQRDYLFYQTRNVENTQIELQAGDDSFHADPSYVFPGTLEEWGIKLGNYQQGATEAGLKISGGPGTDQLFGGALDDKISGGAGDDLIFGSQGNDELLGGGGNDRIFGLKDTSATPLTPRTPNQVIGRPSFGFSEEYRYELVAPYFALPEAGHPGVDINHEEYKSGPFIHYTFDSPTDLNRNVGRNAISAFLTNVSYASDGINGGAAAFQASNSYVGTSNEQLGTAWTASAWFKNLKSGGPQSALFETIDNGSSYLRIGIQENTFNLGMYVVEGASATFYDSGYDVTPSEWADQWHQLTVVSSGSTTRFYLDGQSVGVSNNPARTNGNNLYRVNDQFANRIDEVYVYLESFDAEQVADLYLTSREPFQQLTTQAFGIDGGATDEQLSALRTIGDFNGDGYDDFIASGLTTSHILYGPVQLDAIEQIDQLADIVIDHATFGRPATNDGDIDGNGIADLAFVRNENGTAIATVVLGGATMDAGTSPLAQPWQRHWNHSFVTSYVNNIGQSSFRTINLQGQKLSEHVNVHLLDITGDGKDDVVVLAESTQEATSMEDGHYTIGHVFSGETVKQFVATAAYPQLTAYENLAIIRSQEASNNIQATIAGDVNGDGFDDLLIGNRLMSTTLDKVIYIDARFRPNLTLANGFGSTRISLVMNGIVEEIQVNFLKSNNTLEAIVDQINSKLTSTRLASMVRVNIDATNPSDKLLRFNIVQGVSADLHVIGENGNPLGIGRTVGQIVDATRTSVAIPDLGSVTSSMPTLFNTAGKISHLQVGVAIQHTWVSDLTITLIAPGGQRVQLVSGAGGAGDNFGSFDSNGLVASFALFDDNGTSAASAGVAPFPAVAGYRPDQALSSLNGTDSYGFWNLEVTDSVGSDVGTLVRWYLQADTVSMDLDSTINPALRAFIAPREISQSVSPFLPSLGDDVDSNLPPYAFAGATPRPDRFAITINSFGSESGTPYAIGDLNNDGRDDFAIVQGVPGQLLGQNNIYYGQADRSVSEVPDARLGGYTSVLTSGDFDGDGKLDLAATTAGIQSSSLFVFHSFAAFNDSRVNFPSFSLKDAHIIIPYVDDVQSTRKLSTVDLNGDAIDDIAISSSLAESQSGNLQAGQVYVVYGAFKQVELPTSAIHDLENFSVPGSGSFVVNPETGRSEVFSDAGKPFSLAPAADENWFRFTTLGDGKPGDAIRWLPETEAVALIAEQPVNSPRRRAQDLDLEFWTRASDANIEQSTKLPHVSIQGTGDGTYDYYKFTATAGSRAIFDIDNNNFDTELFLFDANGLLLANNDDGTGPGADAGQGNGRASYVDHTFTSSGTYVIGVAKYNSSESGGEITGPAPAVGDVYRLNVSVDRHHVLGPVDLIDAQGGVVAANQSVFDLRHVPAGTYYLRVHDTISTFTFKFDAPSRGQFAGTTTLPDRDLINGGDGDDVLVGNNDLDRILGGSGADTITAEPIEIRDSTPGDVYVEVPTIERISRDVRPIIDPLVETGNAALNRAIASAIGKPIVWDASGIPQIYGGVRASELASISTLDASGLGIQTYQGLEHLTNLQSLDISNNRVSTQNGTFFGGHYAIASENTDLRLSFGSSVTISGLAIYNGYANRDDGTYTLRDGAGGVIGSWTISGTTGATNEGVDSFWLVFNSPITTSSLSLHADSLDGTTVSYREIEVFQAGATNRPNVGPVAGHLRINAGSSFYLAAHQTETGDNMSSNPDVTSGLGGTRIAYTPTGTFPETGGQYGATQLNNGDVSLANFDTLVGLSNLRALDLSGNSRVTNVQRLSELTNLQSIDLRGTEVWVSAFFPTEYFVSLDLKQLHLTVTGLSTDEHNLTAPQGTTVNLTKAVAGNWIVLGPNSSSFSGSGTTITFTADHAGIYRVYPTGSAAEAIFPFLVTNVAPVISGTPQVVNIDEGDSRTVDQLLAAAGLTISDAGSTPPTRQVTVTDSSGVVTDLTTGSLAMNDDVIRLDSAILDGATDVSVAFWIRTTSAQPAQAIFQAGSSRSNREFALFLESGNQLSLWVEGAGLDSIGIPAGVTLNDGAWHHIAVVRDATDNRWRFYVGGALVGTHTPTQPQTALQVAPNWLNIGNYQSTPGTFDTQLIFNGNIDDAAIWRRALSVEQVAALYADGIVGTEADLAAYYPLNELGGDIAHDRSSNARNGVVRSLDVATPFTWSTDSGVDPKDFEAIDEGDFILTVIAHDDQGASARAEARIQVANLAPTPVIDQKTTGTLVAGAPVKFDALSSTDPGVNDKLSYFWEVLSGGEPAGPVSSESDFEFTPTVAGSYVIKLTVTDSIGASSSTESTITVNPSIAVVANQAGNEGDVFVFDSDGVSPKATNATRTYSWRVLAAGVPISTGAAPTNASTFAFAAPDNGAYSVELTITDTINSVPFHTTQIVSTVVTSNVAPTIAFGATTFGVEGSQVTLSPVIHDAGSVDTLTYLWTVVDQNSNAVVLDTAANLATVSFTPRDNGTYTATLTVTDKDSAVSLPTRNTIIVANQPPLVSADPSRSRGGDIEFDEGIEQINLPLRFYFSEASAIDYDSPFTYKIDFGDGQTQEGTRRRYTSDFWEPSHTYADDGIYVVTFTLTDKDGGVGTATKHVRIRNLDPQNVTLAGPTTADEDTKVTFTGTAADIHNFIARSADNERLRGEIDFGDGTKLPLHFDVVHNVFPEIEANDTYATGQNLEALPWSTAFDPDISDWDSPHVSISATGDNTNDWYQFTATAGSYNRFYVRDRNFDAVMSIVNVATGELTTGEIWTNELNFIDLSSNQTADYAILVQRSDGAGGATTLQPGDEYTLDLLVEFHPIDPRPFEDLKNYEFTSQHIYASPGTYNVTVTVKDDDGGSTTSSVKTITIADTKAPTVSLRRLNKTADSWLEAEVASIEFSFSEQIQNLEVGDFVLLHNGASSSLAGATLVYKDNLKSNGQSENQGRGIWTLGNLTTLNASGGDYELVLNATDSGIADLAGRRLGNNLSVKWTVDRTAPVVTVDSLTTNNSRPLLTGTVDDRSAKIAVTVNGIEYTAENLQDGTWRIPFGTVAPLDVGVYNVIAIATDLLNNVGSDTTTNELVVIEPPQGPDQGADIVITLVEGSAYEILVRKLGDNLVVTDLTSATVLSSTSLANTNSLQIIGTNSDSDSVFVDYATGGYFRLPGGIEFFGGTSPGDALRVTGTGNTRAIYSTDIAPLGNSQITLFDTEGSNRIRYRDYELMTFDGLLTFASMGVLNLHSNALTIDSVGPVDLSSLTLIDGGSLTSTSTVVLGVSETLIGSGTINAAFTGETGSLIDARGPLTLGRSDSSIGFATRGELRVGPHAVTLLDSNQAVLGSLTTLGSTGIASGTLVSGNGMLVDYGNNVTGWGTLQTPNDPNKLVMHNGAISGNNASEPITLTGFVKGVGSINHVNITGTYSPGFSPAVIYNGSVTYGSSSTTIIELGGTTPGSSGFDQLNHLGTASLGGQLEIQLINNFPPQLGQTFEIVTGTLGIAGQFTNVILPPAPSGTGWNLDYEANRFTVELVDLTEVTTIVIGDGTNQRSKVDQLQVTFEGAVDILDGAFKLTHRGSGTIVSTAHSIASDADGNTIATLTFTGELTRGRSNALNDGNYQLSIDPTKVFRAGTLVGLDGDGDGQAGGGFEFGSVAADRFFAFYGDTDGDRDVDGQDYGRFGLTYRRRTNQPGFNPQLDFDGDGDVDGQDYGQFGLRYRKRILFQ